MARQLSNPPLDIGATSILQEDEPGTPPSAAATHAQASPSSSATNRGRGVALDEVTTDAPRDASPLQERQDTVTVKLEEEEIDGEERDELMTDAGSSLEASLPVIPARSLRSARRTSERATTARAGAAGSISDLKQVEDRARKAIRRGLDDHLLDLKLTDRRITLPAVVWMDPFVDVLQEWLAPRYNTRQSPPYVEDAQQTRQRPVRMSPIHEAESIPRPHEARFDDPVVPARPSARLNPAGHVGHGEAQVELEAGLPRLTDLEQHGARSPEIADADIRFGQAAGRER